jgi:hypothetical protein
MAADAWNSATPTNANTVKDTTPDEFQALKVVNINRVRMYGNGIPSLTNYNFAGVANAWSTTEALLFNSTLVTAGAYNAGTGEYTCDKAGWYRVNAQAGRPAAAIGGFSCDYEGLLLQNFSGGVWATFHTSYVPSKTYLNNSARITLAAERMVLLAVGDKLRAQHYAFCSAVANPGAGAYPSLVGTEYAMNIEFIKTP